MKRVGYDGDTERYTFREGDDLWLGEPGSLYGGKLTWAGKADSTKGRESREREEVEEYYTESSDLETQDCGEWWQRHMEDTYTATKVIRSRARTTARWKCWQRAAPVAERDRKRLGCASNFHLGHGCQAPR